MIVKEHIDSGRLFLTVCDDSLIGKKFSKDNFVLDLSSKFYSGEKKTKEEIKALINKAYYINFVGNKSVELGVKEKVIEKDSVVEVDGIPFGCSIFL